MNFDLQNLSKRAECLGTLEPKHTARPLTEKDIAAALARPIWPQKKGPAIKGPAICDIIKPGNSVCFVVSDQTRQTGMQFVLPLVLKDLIEKKCRLSDMFFLCANGIHRKPTAAEFQQILGPAVSAQFEGRMFSHDPDDESSLVTVGTTKRGHSVRVNKRIVETDKLIVTGTANYHFHAGFGGGKKALVPGCAARATIAYNHSLTLDPDADRIRPGVEIGRLDGNPVAEGMLEAAHMCRPDFTINSVMSSSGEMIGLFCGEMDLAHRAACRLVEKTNRVDIASRANFVIAWAESAGNWVQAHKALFNASRAVKEDGVIILVAPCPEGLGDERFRYWIKKKTLPEIYSELRQSVEVNGQTALSTKMRGARTVLITKMSPRDVTDLGITIAPDIDSAVTKFFATHPGRPTCYLMPHAMHTVPFAEEARDKGSGFGVQVVP